MDEDRVTLSKLLSLTMRLALAKRLLAEAAWRHPEDAGWLRRVKQFEPSLESHFTPPCPGEFGPTSCCEFHAHGLRCGSESDICTRCGTTNAQHRAAWAALE